MTDSSKVDSNNGVATTCPLHMSNFGPPSCYRVIFCHLQSGKYHQEKNSPDTSSLKFFPDSAPPVTITFWFKLPLMRLNSFLEKKQKLLFDWIKHFWIVHCEQTRSVKKKKKCNRILLSVCNRMTVILIKIVASPWFWLYVVPDDAKGASRHITKCLSCTGNAISTLAKAWWLNQSLSSYYLRIWRPPL